MAMTVSDYEAYLRGQREYLVGVALCSNPYAPEYSEHRQWARGWKSQEWKMKDAVRYPPLRPYEIYVGDTYPEDIFRYSWDCMGLLFAEDTDTRAIFRPKIAMGEGIELDTEWYLDSWPKQKGQSYGQR